MRRFIWAGSVLLLCACATTQKWYFNDAVEGSQQQAFFNQDTEYCRAVASGAAPIPPIDFVPPGTTRTFGTASIYSRATGFVNVNYSATSASKAGFGEGFQKGTAIGNAGSAGARRKTISDLCMASIGWREIPCLTCSGR